MRIGVYFNSYRSGGGGFQYAVTFLETLLDRSGDRIVVFNKSEDLPKEIKANPELEIVNLVNAKEKRASLTKKIVDFIHNILLRLHFFSLLNWFDKKFRVPDQIKAIMTRRLDLMIFTAPHDLASKLPVKTIVPIHDLQHRLSPQFPEVGSAGPWRNKEYLFSQIAKHATIVLADSKIGKEDVLNYYQVEQAKVQILPFLPPNYLNPTITPEKADFLLKKFHLPNDFFFYPAQFWPHKNHLNLLKAIKILKNIGIIVNLALTGGKTKSFSTYDNVIDLIKNSDLEKQIHLLGYVENDEMSALYNKAKAMIMPTSFGPTNIPILEAWAMGCPVIYSDIRGCREQAGDAALTFNPLDPSDIAEKIKHFIKKKSIALQLIDNGYKRLKLWTKRDFSNKINSLIDSV